jgi:hypothetical protein
VLHEANGTAGEHVLKDIRPSPMKENRKQGKVSRGKNQHFMLQKQLSKHPFDYPIAGHPLDPRQRVFRLPHAQGMLHKNLVWHRTASYGAMF